MDGATTKDPDQRRAEAAGMDAPDASAGLVLSVCFGRVKQDLLAVGTSLGSSGALDSVDVAAWGARVKTAKVIASFWIGIRQESRTFRGRIRQKGKTRREERGFY